MAILLVSGLVIGAIGLGVWGPHLAPRASLSSSTPVGDLLGAIAREERGFPDDPWQTRSVPPTKTESMPGDSLWRRVTAAPLPALEARGWRLVGCLALQGQETPCVLALYRAPSAQGGELLSLCAAASPGRWHVFDRFGRSGPLLPDEPIMESPDRQGTVDRPTLAWSDSRCLYLARANSVESLNDLRQLLGAP